MLTEEMNKYTDTAQKICVKNDTIAPRLYDEYGVNLGLRDENGNGVLTGLTKISKINVNNLVVVRHQCEYMAMNQ